MVDECVRKSMCRKTREEILKKRFPMRFSRWFDESHVKNTNCYGYVFNMWIVSEDDDRFSYLGWTERDAKPYYIKEEAEEAFLLDMKNLRFKVRKLKNIPKPRTNRINFAFFVGKEGEKLNGDFHFVRQNHDGSWSDKLGFGGEVEKFKDIDGKTCLPHKANYDEIEFVGYYQVLVK